MTAALFVISLALLALYGLPAAMHPVIRNWSFAARAGAAFGAGAVAITLSAILLDFVGIVANLLTLSILPLAAAIALTWHYLKTPATSHVPTGSVTRTARIAAITAATLPLLLAFAAVFSGRANSPDFLYFWGIKAARYVAAHGFDPAFLRWPNAIHTHVNYPPLYPLTLAWTRLWSGEAGLWLYGPVMSIVWIAAAAPVVHAVLGTRLRAGGALAVTAFWAAAMSTAIAASYSGGNAEATLLFFATVAAAAILVDVAPLRIVAAVALAGLVLTKLEGTVAAALLLGATLVRDVALRRPRPWRTAALLATGPGSVLALWYAYLLIYRIPLTDPTREPLGRITFEYVDVIAVELLRHLHAGTYGFSWLFPLFLLAVAVRRLGREHLPGVLFTAGLLLFYAGYYLHAAGSPATLIGWTIPRTSLPALSVWILTAGLIGASRAGNRPRL